MKKALIIFLLCAGASTTQAQLLKKIGNRVKQTAGTVGNTVDNKVQDRTNTEASAKADKIMDKAFDGSKRKNKKAAKHTEAETPAQETVPVDSVQRAANQQLR